MSRKPAVLCFLLMSFFAVTHAQNSRFSDSVRLDSLTNLMYEQDARQKYDIGIIYAKEIVSLTYNLYHSSREYAISLNNLGYFYHHNFEYNNAEQYCKKALKEIKKYT